MPDERAVFFRQHNGRKVLSCLQDWDPHGSAPHADCRKSSWGKHTQNICGTSSAVGKHPHLIPSNSAIMSMFPWKQDLLRMTMAMSALSRT